MREEGVGVFGSEEGEEGRGDVGREEDAEEVDAADEARLKDGNGGGEGRERAPTLAEDMRRKEGKGKERKMLLRTTRRLEAGLAAVASFPFST